MKLSSVIKVLFALDIILTLFIAMVLAGITPWRFKNALPEPGREWQEVVKRLEATADEAKANRLEKKQIFQTRRAASRVRQASSALGDYVLSGAGNGKAYFLHKKSNALSVHAIGEEIEGYKVVAITDNLVELEKDGNLVEIPY